MSGHERERPYHHESLAEGDRARFGALDGDRDVKTTARDLFADGLSEATDTQGLRPNKARHSGGVDDM